MGTPHRLERSQIIDRPRPEVFGFFADAANLEAITPDFLRFRMLTRPPIEMRVGTRIDYEISLLGVPMRWRTRISDWQPGASFVDEQESGPYAFWRHRHEFHALGNVTLMRDLVEYREPYGVFGALAHVLFVSRTLQRIFDYRSMATQRAFATHATFATHAPFTTHAPLVGDE